MKNLGSNTWKGARAFCFVLLAAAFIMAASSSYADVCSDYCKKGSSECHIRCFNAKNQKVGEIDYSGGKVTNCVYRSSSLVVGINDARGVVSNLKVSSCPIARGFTKRSTTAGCVTYGRYVICKVGGKNYAAATDNSEKWVMEDGQWAPEWKRYGEYVYSDYQGGMPRSAVNVNTGARYVYDGKTKWNQLMVD